jgi:hypothetical protein
MLEKEAKERQAQSGGDRKSDAYKSVTEKIQQPIPTKKSKNKTKNASSSSQKAAKKLNTNSHYVSDAKKLKVPRTSVILKYAGWIICIPMVKHLLYKNPPKPAAIAVKKTPKFLTSYAIILRLILGVFMLK